MCLVLHHRQMAKRRCRARTDNGHGALCRNLVREQGQRCHLHIGQPEAPVRQYKPRRSTRTKSDSSTKRRPSPGRDRTTHRSQLPGHEQRHSTSQRTRTATRSPRSTSQRTTTGPARPTKAAEERRKKRVEEAQDFCVDVLTDGWQDAVEARVADYITTDALRRISKRQRNACKSLATFASKVLDCKDRLHEAVASVVRWIVALLTGNWAVQVIARKLATKIPLPWDAKMVAVARGIQVIGVLVCLNDGRDLTHCQCFIDLAINETKERVKQILATAVGDWRNLARFPAPVQPPPGQVAAGSGQ
jgi:hypothetical protein